MKSALIFSFLGTAVVLLPMKVGAQNSVTVEGTLEFGMFDDWLSRPETARNPTQAEMDALITRISQWWTESLTQTIPALESFEAVYLCHTFNANAELPITIDFDGIANFPDGQEPASKWDVSKAMEASDLQDFIMNAVWTKDLTGGPFDDVQLASFKSRDGNIPIVCNTGFHNNEATTNESEQQETTEQEVNNNNNNSEETNEEVIANSSEETNEGVEEEAEAEAEAEANPSFLCGATDLSTSATAAAAAAVGTFRSTASGQEQTSNDGFPVPFDPACLEEQDCQQDSDSLSQAAIEGSIHCNFTLVTYGYSYNDDYPTCTNSTYEDREELGELISIPLDAIIYGETNNVITPLTIELDTDRNFGKHENVSVSWGIGATCDGQVVLFFSGAEDHAAYYWVIGVESLSDVLTSGIMGTGYVTGSELWIHRRQRQRQRRRTHVGCTIGGSTHFNLEGTCHIDAPQADHAFLAPPSSHDDDVDLGTEDDPADTSSSRSSPLMVASVVGAAWVVSSLLMMLAQF